MNASAPMSFSALPALGAALEGGTFRGITTLKDGTHAAIVLLDAKTDVKRDWQSATAWAAEVGGQLPSRPVAALLYANAKAEFEPTWHWTSDQLVDDIDDTNKSWAESSAWLQYFDFGNQYGYVKSFACRCRAVRLIHLIP